MDERTDSLPRPATAIEVRDRRFRFDARRIPRHWHGGRRSVTIFFDNLSIFFPLGERFFVAAVRAHAHAVVEEGLRRDVRAFCAQEGIHAREHDGYNAMLRERYPAEAMEREVGALLDRVRRRSPPRMRLAVTCALEHFTALMGKAVLEDPRTLAGADPAMAALWRWHAAEENEHKCVAYDVFLAAGGTYGERAVAMLGATVVFWTKVLEHQARMMRASGTAGSIREWAALLSFLFVTPGAMRAVVRDYFAFYRPGFHPGDIDGTSALRAWAAEDAPPADPS